MEKNCKNCNQTLDNIKNLYCSNRCQLNFQYKKYIEDWKSGNISGLIGSVAPCLSRHIRKYMLEKYNYKCTKCGWDEINPTTALIPLEIEHIDGNWLNNKEENLTVLCPNCHSLTPTFRNLNRGKGRRHRLFSLSGKAPHL